MTQDIKKLLIENINNSGAFDDNGAAISIGPLCRFILAHMPQFPSTRWDHNFLNMLQS